LRLRQAILTKSTWTSTVFPGTVRGPGLDWLFATGGEKVFPQQVAPHWRHVLEAGEATPAAVVSRLIELA
jgi:hypothetical protein